MWIIVNEKSYYIQYVMIEIDIYIKYKSIFFLLCVIGCLCIENRDSNKRKTKEQSS